MSTRIKYRLYITLRCPDIIPSPEIIFKQFPKMLPIQIIFLKRLPFLHNRFFNLEISFKCRLSDKTLLRGVICKSALFSTEVLQSFSLGLRRQFGNIFHGICRQISSREKRSKNHSRMLMYENGSDSYLSVVTVHQQDAKNSCDSTISFGGQYQNKEGYSDRFKSYHCSPVLQARARAHGSSPPKIQRSMSSAHIDTLPGGHTLTQNLSLKRVDLLQK